MIFTPDHPMTDERYGHRVLISVSYTDQDNNMIAEMYEYIVNAELNLIRFSEVDVSDVSPTTDIICEYVFESEQDALMFQLRWQK